MSDQIKLTVRGHFSIRKILQRNRKIDIYQFDLRLQTVGAVVCFVSLLYALKGFKTYFMQWKEDLWKIASIFSVF